ncbi:MAG: SDR family oxidoreductase [Halieaceae bacterium]|jgi:7-alpha-hydroxysteroid dehydrogenase|nr:SDR family oxidoreductase [Halieaceae bacterium]
MAILDNFSLAGQVAVVTGGGKGIGRGIALCLAEAGADVAVASRNVDDLAEVVAAIEALGRRALAVPTDVTSAEQLDALGEAVSAELGAPTIWVNNAGGLPDATPRYLTRTPEDRWDAQIDLNLKSVWMGSRVAASHMQEGGCIINISSRTAMGPQPKNGPYAAAKAATNSLTQTLSVELAPAIRVNAIAPGPVPTQNFMESTGTTEDTLPAVEEAIGLPLKRVGRVEDIGAAVVFMASPAASWITGQCLYVDGGM